MDIIPINEEFDNVTATSRRLDFEDISDHNIHGEKSTVQDEVPIEMIPKLQMEFSSEQEAYEFYNRYARKSGFSIRKGRDHKNRFGEVQDRSVTCSCEGQRSKDKRSDIVKNHRPVTRLNCKAEMKISNRATGTFQIVKFVSDHNHKLASPNKCHLLRSQRCLTIAQAAEIEMADSVGITPKAGVDLMAEHVGGRENLGFIPIDYKNYLRTKRAKQMGVGDTGGVLEYLQQMREEDPNFFYAIQVDSESMITNIFWADGKMIIDYDYFGDVVCFDTTYRKVNENRPFGLFVGVNNHKQTIIFGAALLYDETADTFKWLFDSFIKAMGGKKPKCMLTDQDAAMANALVSCWPETHHRLCLWHIFQNAAKHLYSLIDDSQVFSKKFQSCIYDYEDEDEFLSAWFALRKEFYLEDNAWLDQLFSCKEKWALVYGRQTFCADMTTTQRSECMNNQLKRYVNPKLDMLRFFQHFNRLIEDVRYGELKNDFKAYHTKPVLAFQSEILRHAAEVYTPTMFEIFQIEMGKILDSEMLVTNEDGTMCEYKITPYGSKWSHTVRYDSSIHVVTCSCQKFEFVGILCAHVLKVMAWKNVKKIPDNYILRRWTKNAKVGHERTMQKIGGKIDVKEKLAIRYKDLRMHFNRFAARAAESDETYAYALKEFDRLLLEVDDKLKCASIKDPCLTTMETGEDEYIQCDENYVKKNLKPTGLKKKKVTTRISSKRVKSAFEKAMEKRKGRKNQKVCQPSRQLEHSVTQTNYIIPTSSTNQAYYEIGASSTHRTDQYTNQQLLMMQQYPLHVHHPNNINVNTVSHPHISQECSMAPPFGVAFSSTLHNNVNLGSLVDSHISQQSTLAQNYSQVLGSNSTMLYNTMAPDNPNMSPSGLHEYTSTSSRQ